MRSGARRARRSTHASNGGAPAPRSRRAARILDEGDPYKDELLETARLVAEKADVEQNEATVVK